MWIFSSVGWQLSSLRWAHILFALENFVVLNYNFNPIFIGQLSVSLVHGLRIFLIFRMFHLFGLLTINRNTCEGAREMGKPNSGETRKGNQPAEKEKTCSKIKVS